MSDLVTIGKPNGVAMQDFGTLMTRRVLGSIPVHAFASVMIPTPCAMMRMLTPTTRAAVAFRDSLKVKIVEVLVAILLSLS